MKLYIYAGIAVALMAFSYWAYGQVYDAGYDAAVVKMQEEAILRQNEAIEAARAEWELTAAAAEREIVIEERIVEVIREVEREIPTVVERIVEVTPECADLGPEFLGVFNAAISASNNRADTSTGSATEPDGTL